MSESDGRTDTWLQSTKEKCVVAMRRGDGELSKELHIQILLSSNTKQNLNQYTALVEIILPFVTTKKSMEVTTPFQIIWFYKMYTHFLCSLLDNAFPSTQRSYIVASKALFFLLKTSVMISQKHIVTLWEHIVNCFKTRKTVDFLTTVSSTLSELYNLTITIPEIDSVLLNVSFDQMVSVSSSQERSAVVEFFRIISTYNQNQFTNSVSVAMSIVEPLVANTEIAQICNREYVDGMAHILNNIDVYGKDLQMENVDVSGVVLFFTELLKEDFRFFSLYNYSIVFMTVGLIGFGLKSSQVDSVDLICSFLKLEVDDTNEKVDKLLTNVITNLYSRIDFSQEVPVTLYNSFITMTGILAEKKCSIYSELSQKGIFDNIFRVVQNSITSHKVRGEEIEMMSKILIINKHQVDRKWWLCELKRWGSLHFLSQFFITETTNLRNCQAAYSALGNLISFLVFSPIENLSVMKESLYAFLSIPTTLPPRVKSAYLKKLEKIEWEDLIKFDSIHRLLPVVQVKTILFRIVHNFLEDPDEFVRQTAQKTFADIVYITASQKPQDFVLRFLTKTACETQPLFRLTALQAINCVLSKMSDYSQTPFLISRSDNSLGKLSEKYLQIIHNEGMNLIRTSIDSYGRGGGLSIVNGLISISECVQFISRTETTLKRVPKCYSECFTFFKSVLYCLIEVIGVKQSNVFVGYDESRKNVVNSPIWGVLIQHLGDLEIISKTVESPVNTLVQKTMMALSTLIRSCGLDESGVTEMCKYVRLFRSFCPSESLVMLREILESQLEYHTIQIQDMSSITLLFKEWDYWLMYDTTVKFIGSRVSWGDINDTSVLLLEEFLSRETTNFDYRCALINYGYFFVRIGVIIGSPRMGESAKIKVTTQTQTDYFEIYTKLKSQIEFTNQRLSKIEAIYPNKVIPSFYQIPPIDYSSSPDLLVEELTRMKTKMSSTVFYTQFHVYTLLRLTDLCISLYNKVLHTSTTTLISQCADIFGNIVNEYLRTKDSVLKGTQNGYNDILKMVEDDKTLSNKGPTVVELKKLRDLLTSFHLAFDILLNILETTFTHGKYCKLTVTLFTCCAMQIFWSIRSSRNTHLFFLKPITHIDLTSTFIRQVAVVANFPRIYRTDSFGKIFEVAYLCSSGMIKQQAAYLQLKDKKKFGPIVEMMRTANWCHETVNENLKFGTKNVHKINKTVAQIQRKPFEVVEVILNSKLKISGKVCEQMAFFISKNPKAYERLKEKIPSLPDKSCVELFDFFSENVQKNQQKYKHLNYESPSEDFLEQYTELARDTPFMRDSALVSPIPQLEKLKLDEKVESRSETIEKERIEKLFTIMYLRTDKRFYAKIMKLDIPRIVYAKMVNILPYILIKHIDKIPLYDTKGMMVDVLNDTTLLSTTFWQHKTPPVSSRKEAISILISLSRSLAISTIDLAVISALLFDEFCYTKEPFYLISIVSFLFRYDNIVSLGLENPRILLTWGQLPVTTHWGILNKELIKKVELTFFTEDNKISNVLDSILHDENTIQATLRLLAFFQNVFETKNQELLYKWYSSHEMLQSTNQIIVAYNQFSLYLTHPKWQKVNTKKLKKSRQVGFILATHHNIPALLTHQNVFIYLLKTLLEGIFDCNSDSIIFLGSIIEPPIGQLLRITISFLVSLLEACTVDDIPFLINLFGKNIVPSSKEEFEAFIKSTKTIFVSKLQFMADAVTKQTM
ncbi:hypothetical protein EIN_018790 [Entamoeba invadens IP1]|uniref:hypothetical protein n=1 Tax=Entamoeba invadens IP1 TaxID=370355 RepID=UPI0002C3CF18|nr:hypothetical protein EIN_018790 [Entamoeba invadens IP1]ELP90520.1 hypothetical protein EIN_018790 [Entamoeba invadens IP1]|eukprot:XP_004257291.1 hypothetical protein EIN_018790 [Entamoeba invadens IP1]